ncbi:uncharacterized protein LOC141860187 isoform X4 [Acropora palmata]|uniref:uncharacterized protein LOC141860187 isoform X4 n=1 Tax=Acropora palmata TaxID=6131 RepID=UPI003DA022A6
MVVSRFRVLAITHLVVGALLIIFGIFDGVTSLLGDDFMFWSPFGLFGISTGTGQWLGVTGSKCQMCIAGSLGIPGSTPQRTRMRSCFVGKMVVIFPITKLVRDIGPRILRWCQSQKHVGFQQLYRFYFEREPLITSTVG